MGARHGVYLVVDFRMFHFFKIPFCFLMVFYFFAVFCSIKRNGGGVAIAAFLIDLIVLIVLKHFSPSENTRDMELLHQRHGAFS